jgi:hypothetical protein
MPWRRGFSARPFAALVQWIASWVRERGEVSLRILGTEMMMGGSSIEIIFHDGKGISAVMMKKR